MISTPKYRILLVLFSLFALFFLNLVFSLKEQNNWCADCENYIEAAFYFYKDFKVHYYRPVGMALLYGVPILFGIENYEGLFVYILSVNIMFYLGILLLFFEISKNFISVKKSFVLCLLLLTYFGISLNVFRVLSEIPFLFFLLTAFYFFSKYYKFNSTKHLYYAVAVLLFCILIRPGILFFSIGVALFYFPKIIKTVTVRRAIILFVPISLLLFQMIKMKQQYGDFTISYIDAVTYYNYLGSKAVCMKDGRVLNQNTNERAKYIHQQTYKNQKKIAYQDLWYQAINNPFYMLKAYINNIEENTKTPTSTLLYWKNIKKEKYFAQKLKFVSILTEWQNKLTTLVGLFLSFYFIIKYKKRAKIIYLLLFYFLYVFLISGISSTQGDRFHIVFYPIVLLLLGFFLNDLRVLKHKL